MANRHMIISIVRECGSGGHEIGEKLAEHYGISLYDRNLIEKLAEETNQDPEKLAQIEERVTGRIFPTQKNGFASEEHMMMNKLSKSDRLYLQEKGLILKMAEEESFVIIGRAANAILADHPDTLRLYVYASEAFKLPRVKEFYHLDTDQEARKKMEQVDKARRAYFNFYSDAVWGSSDAHDFMISSSVFGIDETVKIIIDIAERKFSK